MLCSRITLEVERLLSVLATAPPISNIPEGASARIRGYASRLLVLLYCRGCSYCTLSQLMWWWYCIGTLKYLLVDS